ncbi:actin related protein 6 [Tieghemostelium lacteum]|uniref:Actin related protein 6 n=1 Tax=Tieghemostelium lacteum TaxID=361077 RepID=A0A151ZK33_TIELA|nr:actin related protein 6 [Tieghemostelium lacteum]|eukprot:KYQ94358.1 actin related protein 6 [Tieghemostelium lacteum]
MSSTFNQINLNKVLIIDNGGYNLKVATSTTTSSTPIQLSSGSPLNFSNGSVVFNASNNGGSTSNQSMGNVTPTMTSINSNSSSVNNTSTTSTPPLIIPNHMAKMDQTIYMGDDLVNLYNSNPTQQQIIKTRNPMDKGFVVDWDLEKEIWDSVLKRDDLKIKPTEYSLLLTEAPFALDEIRKSLYQVVFEKYRFKSLSLQTPATLALLNHRQKTSTSALSPPCHLVVDCGYSWTTIIPHFQNTKLNYAIKRFAVGGKLLTNYLRDLIGSRHQQSCDFSMKSLNQIKEKSCYLSMDFIRDLNQCKLTPDQYSQGVSSSMPMLTNERFSVPELIFNPSDIGIQQAGLAESIVQSVQCTNINLHQSLYSNILLIGGSTMFPNFKARLENDLRRLIPDQYSINIVHAEDPILYPIYGAIKLSQQPDFHKYSCLKQEYDECGPSLCNRKFF